MLERFRGAWAAILAPIAKALVRAGVSPDLVTVVGTIGVVLGALICFPQGWLWQGVLILTPIVFSDMLDGQMAKITNSASKWGAFLDSTADRLGDAAVFGGILLFFIYQQNSGLWAGVTLIALVFGQLTSYVKARAESLGFTCTGGLAARADRMLIILVGAFFADVGVPYLLEVVVSALAVASIITVGQRIAQVRRQAKVADVDSS
jgi:CDP-diacylglycerol---glycerol-3-phosphate 3-phosphatidyltransferase